MFRDINFEEVIKKAIANNDIILHYQPIIKNDTEKIFKYEALVRLRYKGNIIYPDVFLNKIKNTQTHYELTRYIISTVFKKIINTGKLIAINLHISDMFYHSDFIIDQIEKNKILQKCLFIEILEDDFGNSKERKLFISNCNKIRSYGVKISIDDFGAGSSNYERILQIHPDIIKIDGILIRSMQESELAKNIVISIITLAKKSGIDTVAEYIETKELFEITKKMGVDYSQGYYFSKPLAASDCFK